MMIEYKCCFCRKSYEWYGGIYENPNYDEIKERKARRQGEEYNEDSGVYIGANGFTLCCINPINDNIDAREPIKIESVGGNLDVYMNMCPECMRKVLDNLFPDDERHNAWET